MRNAACVRGSQLPAIDQGKAMTLLVKAVDEPWKCSVEAAGIGKEFRNETSLQQATSSARRSSGVELCALQSA